MSVEWTVVTVLIGLTGLLTALIRPVVSLTRSITELTVSVRELRAGLSDLAAKNAESHKRLWQQIDRQESRLHRMGLH